MPAIALSLFAIFVLLGFGWRSWEQRRRTGSTGFRGISGRPGSAEWFGGVGFVAALVGAVVAPALQLAGVVMPLAFLTAPWIQLVGVLVAILGIAATLLAQIDMGESWRIGVDDQERTDLVRTGVFGRVRNPIFAAMLIFASGLVLITPNVVAVAAFAAMIASIEVQVRVVEEPYLLRVHGQPYRDYLGTVGRFAPRLGLRR
ncbi:MAG: isoprenylcysteine carboxylmethyltransferase family protein [Mycobacteriaceae bacterium]